jgi:hypothetical protein
LGRRYCYCYVHLSRNTANNLLTLPLIWGYWGCEIVCIAQNKCF